LSRQTLDDRIEREFGRGNLDKPDDGINIKVDSSLSESRQREKHAGTRLLALHSVGPHYQPIMIYIKFIRKIFSGVTLVLVFAACAFAQSWIRELKTAPGDTIEIVNLSGRVHVSVRAAAPREENGNENEGVGPETRGTSITATSTSALADSDIKIEVKSGRTRIEVLPLANNRRIDLNLEVPERTRLIVETRDGDVQISGNIQRADVVTDTGTIATEVPTDEIKYDLVWTTSRPRFLSDFELEKVKEKAGGKFVLNGTYKADETNDTESAKDEERAENGFSTDPKPKQKRRNKNIDSTRVSLNFTTARGIVLLNVPPNEVSSDLRERPLTKAAKAIVRSGDKVLTDAIRRASPKHFGDYAKTLPPVRREPELVVRTAGDATSEASVKRAAVRVTDQFNRAIPGLKAGDFLITENGAEREIISVAPITAPFNLVLLLDVSGSVDNYVNFIRKAARSFVDTVDRGDRISIVLFNDDIKVLSTFTTDKGRLSESLDTFDAGGGTAYYDALAYTLADTLRPLKGERTAIVVLTDGDDNRSFLSFDGLIGAIQESGALIYPLYVPSGLIATSASSNLSTQIDPLRMRYIGLTSKAEGEGEKLASVSGGIYYPITQLSQIQKAYDDIVVQLRTAYSITYRSTIAEANSRLVSPRTKVRIKRTNAFAALGPITRVAEQ